MHSVRAWWAGALIAISQIGLFSLPARANDTRTSCCADLEALISQLTAAVSRSDNSERYIRIYGQLNRAVMFWDDDGHGYVYVCHLLRRYVSC